MTERTKLKAASNKKTSNRIRPSSIETPAMLLAPSITATSPMIKNEIAARSMKISSLKLLQAIFTASPYPGQNGAVSSQLEHCIY